MKNVHFAVFVILPIFFYKLPIRYIYIYIYILSATQKDFSPNYLASSGEGGNVFKNIPTQLREKGKICF